MNQRAIEAGARALAAKRKFELSSDLRHFAPNSKTGLALSDAAAVITAYEAHLKAEGFVVVRAEPTVAMLAAGQKAWLEDPLRKSSTLYRAMLSAATTGENEALPDGERP